jgi:hypothetical protein
MSEQSRPATNPPLLVNPARSRPPSRIAAGPDRIRGRRRGTAGGQRGHGKMVADQGFPITGSGGTRSPLSRRLPTGHCRTSANRVALIGERGVAPAHKRAANARRISRRSGLFTCSRPQCLKTPPRRATRSSSFSLSVTLSTKCSCSAPLPILLANGAAGKKPPNPYSMNLDFLRGGSTKA